MGKGKGGIKTAKVSDGTLKIAKRLSPKATAKVGQSVAAALNNAADKGTVLNKGSLMAILTTKGSNLSTQNARRLANDLIKGNSSAASGKIANPLKGKASKIQMFDRQTMFGTKNKHSGNLKEKMDAIKAEKAAKGDALGNKSSKMSKGKLVDMSTMYDLPSAKGEPPKDRLSNILRLKAEAKAREEAKAKPDALSNKSSKMNLKMEVADIQFLKDKISTFAKEKGINLADMQKQYQDGNAGQDNKPVPSGMDKNMRFRWNVVWAAKINIGSLYEKGLNDLHIDSALELIMKDLTSQKQGKSKNGG